MRLVIAEKPFVTLALAEVLGANRCYEKATLEGEHSPEGLQEPAKRKEVQCESIVLGRGRR